MDCEKHSKQGTYLQKRVELEEEASVCQSM